jgi:hypothetical protein
MDDDARPFLQTLWQVDAAAIGLSVAIVLFAFELVWSTRYRGTLRHFARDIWLVYVLALGLAALFTIGADLLGFGSGAPAGWAANWAVASSALALGSLPVLLLRAIAATDPETLHERNLQQVRALTIAATEQDISRRVAANILKENADSVGVDVQMFWFSDPPPGGKYVYPRKAGTVTDIRLGYVRRIGSGDPGSQQDAVPSVLVEIGKYVGPDTAIAIVHHAGSKAEERAAQRSIRVSSERRRDLLRHAIEKLHEAALESIRSGLPVSYSDIADEYLEILIALPAAWRRYGVPYSGGIAGGASPFELTALDWLTDNLWEEMREASRGTSREVAMGAFFLPYRVALRAVDFNASALFTKMLALYVQLYPVVRTAPDDDVRRLLLHRCVDHPTSLTKMALAHEMQKETLTEERREQLEGFLERAYTTFAELAKAVMEEDPADAATIGTLNADWDEIFQHWNPQWDPPDPWQIQQAEQQLGPAHPDTVALKDRAARRDRLVETREKAIAWRSTLRFALAYWAYHRLKETSDADWLKPFETFRGYFGDLEQLTAAADRAINYQDRGPWFFWRLNQMSSGAFAGPQVDWEMIYAYLVLAVFHVDPAQSAPMITKPRFLEHQLREVEEILMSVRSDAALWALIPAPTDADRRWAKLRRGLRSAARQP